MQIRILWCMQSTSVRVDRQTHEELKKLARDLGTTVGEAVAVAARPVDAGAVVQQGMAGAGDHAILAPGELAAQLEGEPIPLERTLAEALDPARFMLGRARKHDIVASSQSRDVANE